jgi:hypothetical protein
MHRDAFKPGDSVAPGLYWVHHYQHRLTHLCRVALQRFPTCAKCGDKVRFTAAETGVEADASWLRLDADFRDTARSIPLREENGGAEA